jgi:beta-ketodecanoyl-[acyl-carrier-protein] synthase
VLGTRLATQYSNNIRNNAGFLNRCEDTDPDARDKTFMQEGRKVFKEVVPMAAAHIESHLPPGPGAAQCAATGCTRPTWA